MENQISISPNGHLPRTDSNNMKEHTENNVRQDTLTSCIHPEINSAESVQSGSNVSSLSSTDSLPEVARNAVLPEQLVHSSPVGLRTRGHIRQSLFNALPFCEVDERAKSPTIIPFTAPPAFTQMRKSRSLCGLSSDPLKESSDHHQRTKLSSEQKRKWTDTSCELTLNKDNTPSHGRPSPASSTISLFEPFEKEERITDITSEVTTLQAIQTEEDPFRIDLTFPQATEKADDLEVTTAGMQTTATTTSVSTSTSLICPQQSEILTTATVSTVVTVPTPISLQAMLPSVSTRGPVTARCNESVIFTLPLPRLIKCPEDFCIHKINAELWPHCKYRLVNHLQVHHKLIIRKQYELCTICNSLIEGDSLRHKCFEEWKAPILDDNFLPDPSDVNEVYIENRNEPNWKFLTQPEENEHDKELVDAQQKEGKTCIAADTDSALNNYEDTEGEPMEHDTSSQIGSELILNLSDRSGIIDSPAPLDPEETLAMNPRTSTAPDVILDPNSHEQAIPTRKTPSDSQNDFADHSKKSKTTKVGSQLRSVIIRPPRKLKKKPVDLPDNMTCPEKHKRTGTLLHIVLPTKDALACTEPDCYKVFKARYCAGAKFSLRRHLKQAHRLPITDFVIWCTICKNTIHHKITLHSCFESTPHMVEDSQACRFQCEFCDEKFPSKTAIRSHHQWHKTFKGNQLSSKNFLKDEPPIGNVPDKRRKRRKPRHVTNDRPEHMENTGDPPRRVVLADNADTNDVTDLSHPGGKSPITKTDRIVVIERSHTVPQVRVPERDEEKDDEEDNDTSFRNTQDILAEVLTEQSLPPAQGSSNERQQSLQQQEDEPECQLHPFTEILDNFLEAGEDLEWDAFEECMDNIIDAAHSSLNILPPEVFAAKGKSKNRNGPRALQRLYRNNRRRAMRNITEDRSVPCDLEPEDIARHFCGERNAEFDDSIFMVNNNMSELPEFKQIMKPFNKFEVAFKLQASENSAPGNDRLTYNQWKMLDPGCKILVKIFNICLQARRIPSSWKQTRTILIHKGKDPLQPTNWRPISLGTTIYRLFTGCLASRLRYWAETSSFFSLAQKGYLAFDGCIEHNYILEQRLNNARNSKTDCCIASIDLTDAFGSVPHEILFAALEATTLHKPFIQMIRNLYDECYTTFVTSQGESQPIRITRGVRQGCPLSGLLFNIVIDVALKAIHGNSTTHTALAYADDVLILAESPQILQDRLNIFADYMCKLGLSINTSKTCTMHLSGRQPTGTRNTKFTINNFPIKVVQDKEPVRFLGKPVGFSLTRNANDMRDFRTLAEKILDSQLAPWQKLDAMKTFFYPALAYAMRTNQFLKTAWSKLDTLLRPALKKTLNLQDAAANEYLYGDRTMGMIGLPLAAEDSDVACVDTAFKLLDSSDMIVKEIAIAELKSMVASASDLMTVTPADAEVFLSGGEMPSSTGAPASVWTRARKASRRLEINWAISDDWTPAIILEEGSITSRNKVFRSLRKIFRLHRSKALVNSNKFGRSFHLIAKHKCNAHFVPRGDYIRTTDWSFIHRARLGMSPLNAYTIWKPGNDPKCRICGYASETLAHVLCHCKRHMPTITKRHNDLLERVKNCARGWTILRENQAVIPDSRLRPDLLLIKDRTAVLVDTAFAFESGPEAFDEARRRKEEKYEPLLEPLKSQLNVDKIYMMPIIMGPLGTWDVKNDKLLAPLLCSKKYLNLMRKLAVADAIRTSRDIYVEHVTGKKQIPWQFRPKHTGRTAYDPAEVPKATLTLASAKKQKTRLFRRSNAKRNADPADTNPPSFTPEEAPDIQDLLQMVNAGKDGLLDQEIPSQCSVVTVASDSAAQGH